MHESRPARERVWAAGDFGATSIGQPRITHNRFLRLQSCVPVLWPFPASCRARRVFVALKELLVMVLREKFRARLQDKPKAIALLDQLFLNPYITVARAERLLDVSKEAKNCGGKRCGQSAAESKTILNALRARDETAEICRDKDGSPEPDPELRDTESVPLKESIEEYFKREVLPHARSRGGGWWTSSPATPRPSCCCSATMTGC